MRNRRTPLLAHLVTVEVELFDRLVVLEHLRKRRRPHRPNLVAPQVDRRHSAVDRECLCKLLGTLRIDPIVPQTQRVERRALVDISRHLLGPAIPHLAVAQIDGPHAHPRGDVAKLQVFCTLGGSRVVEELALNFWFHVNREGGDVEVSRLEARRMLVAVVELAEGRQEDGGAAGEARVALLDASKCLGQLLHQERHRGPPVVVELGKGLVHNRLGSLVCLHRRKDEDLKRPDAGKLPLPVALLLEVGGTPEGLATLDGLELLLLPQPLQ
mmetsp:Transcript_39701/g.99392  ORF Transcript_39701/g.99392 Transcript_39701/m.99392 type:complete len:270 (-) Transcript_39701:300-1109(-)